MLKELKDIDIIVKKTYDLIPGNDINWKYLNLPEVTNIQFLTNFFSENIQSDNDLAAFQSENEVLVVGGTFIQPDLDSTNFIGVVTSFNYETGDLSLSCQKQGSEDIFEMTLRTDNENVLSTIRYGVFDKPTDK